MTRITHSHVTCLEAGLVALLLFSASTAAAYDEAYDTPEGTFTATMEQAQNAPFPILSGGIAEDADLLKQVEHEYNLKLLFTGAKGEYLSGTHVNISGKAIPSTDIVSSGPFLLMKLPTGSYHLTIDHHGDVKTLNTKVSGNGLTKHQFAFHVPADNEPFTE